jgi:quinol monooxygenase YgiN
MSKVAMIAKITTQPGKRDEAVGVLQKLVDAAGDEPGTITYVLHTEPANPEAIWFYELYQDADALKAHSSSSAMGEVFGPLGPLLDGAPELISLVPQVGKNL